MVEPVHAPWPVHADKVTVQLRLARDTHRGAPFTAVGAPVAATGAPVAAVGAPVAAVGAPVTGSHHELPLA